MVAAVVLLMVSLTVAFAHAARSIWREHEARHNRIQRQLQKDAIALLNRLLRQD